MERVFGRANDSNLTKEASCKKVSTYLNLSAVIYESIYDYYV